MILAPQNNPLYNTPAAGGKNPCILGNYPSNVKREFRTGMSGMNVLPNCVGFVTGRFNELAGLKTCKWLGDTHAKNYINFAKAQSLKTGTTPAAGAVIVWGGGSGYGHAAVVEQVINPETIIVSESGWNSKRAYWTAVHQRGDGNWVDGESWMMSGGYYFLGFVYPPEEEDEMDQEKFNEFMDNYLAERAKLPASAWARDSIDELREARIMNGDANGQMRPKSWITREEAAVMINNALKTE